MVDSKEDVTAKELIESLKDALLQKWLFEDIEEQIAKSRKKKRSDS